AQGVLAEAGRVVACADRRRLLRHLGRDLALELTLVAPELQHLGVVQAEPLPEAGALRAEIEQGQVELLHARTIEEVGERLAAGRGEELVTGLEVQAGPLDLGQQARDLADPLAEDLLLLVDGDVRMVRGEARERVLRLLELLARLEELAPEEVLGG